MTSQLQVMAPSSRTPSWSLVTDLCLELETAREALERQDEDLVQLVAARRYAVYRRLGGSVLTEGAIRAKVRHQLRTGEEL
jgi:hypothetical protein